MTVPRKLPRTQDQRVQNVSRTHAAQSLGGSTAAARPVANVKPDVKLYQPPSGSFVASATYKDPRSNFDFGFGDPSSKYRSFGADTSWFAYDSGAPGVRLLAAGWYQVAVDGFIGSATTGDIMRVYGLFTTPLTVEGIDIVDSTGSAYPNCVTLPFYDDGTGTVIQVQVVNQTVPASGSQSNPTIHLVAFG